MTLVPSTTLLQEAKDGHYAIGAFNFDGMMDFQGIIAASEELQIPCLTMASQGAVGHCGIDYLAAIASTAAKLKTVPFALHLDHGQSFEIAMQAIRAGFTSVMIDGSKLPYDENVALTRKVVEAAHAAGVVVEGELGRIGGKEDDIDVKDRDALLTDPDMAVDFVKNTGLDIFAPAIGSSHGFYKGTPQLDFGRLDAIRSRLPQTYLALHGGTGLSDDDFKQVIQLGITKVNVGTDLKSSFTKRVQAIFQDDPEVFDTRKYLGPAREAVTETVKRYMKLFRGLA
ncbi:ketose-bisphosphate aldolase [candidate division KSB3 bacterium]|uniref:Ketose-bisphosphate aldolase n=1 Tax=candidate division KSB3 bacterium TaxID=2044937 RepID=A0A9D5JVZ5_9BACT|nr:ketose-bisphosphate aldolase [candidate division KSB3 bacterium]MBD3325299.1 ketose-bisphosphate aldolase [candidate division KSB3 bacterium]